MNSTRTSIFFFFFFFYRQVDDLLEERESWVSVSINWEGNLERDWNANCSVLGVLYRGRGVIAGIFFLFCLCGCSMELSVKLIRKDFL